MPGSAVGLRLEATAEGRSAGIGERLAVPTGRRVAVRLEVRVRPAAWPGCAGPTAPVPEAGLGAGDTGKVEWTTIAGPGAWVRAEVRRPPAAGGSPGAMVALTNPVLLGPAGA